MPGGRLYDDHPSISPGHKPSEDTIAATATGYMPVSIGELQRDAKMHRRQPRLAALYGWSTD